MRGLLTERSSLAPGPARGKSAGVSPAPETPADPSPVHESPAYKNMDRWLGDGGMAIIGAVGGSLDSYGPEEGGWARGTWVPTALACNPHGIVQAGVHAILLDAGVNFALNAGLTGKDRTRATLEIKCEYLRTARAGDRLSLAARVVKAARQVGWAEATITDADGRVVSKATSTFLLARQEEPGRAG